MHDQTTSSYMLLTESLKRLTKPQCNHYITMQRYQSVCADADAPIKNLFLLCKLTLTMTYQWPRVGDPWTLGHH